MKRRCKNVTLWAIGIPCLKRFLFSVVRGRDALKLNKTFFTGRRRRKRKKIILTYLELKAFIAVSQRDSRVSWNIPTDFLLDNNSWWKCRLEKQKKKVPQFLLLFADALELASKVSLLSPPEKLCSHYRCHSTGSQTCWKKWKTVT